MSIRTKTKKHIKEMGCTVNVVNIGNTYDIDCEAPQGKKFAANDCHIVCAGGFTGEPKWVDSYWESIEKDLAEGLVDCEDNDCEWCNGI